MEHRLALAPQSAIRTTTFTGVSFGLAVAACQGVIHSADGWQSFNGLNGELARWQPSEWRKDSRIELIFEQAQPESLLRKALADCLI